jgi:predicted RNase H-like HicB family nuclease
MPDARALFLSFVIVPNEDGYLASVPGLQGAFAEGDTVEEAIFNCIEVAKLIMAYRKERGEPLGYTEVDITPETRITLSVPVGIL